MNFTEEQKEIIKSGVEDFDKKFIAIKNKWRNMGYEEDECNELAWASFVMLKANITPEDYEKYYNMEVK